MKSLSLARAFAPVFVICAVSARPIPVAIVRHAPTLNGTLDGSIQQMTAEAVTLNGGASVTGDLLVPGSPTVRVNGHPVFSGTVDGAGSASPSDYQVTLNGNAKLRHVVRRTNPVPLPSVGAPPAPSGTRTVTINSAGQSAGDFSTLRNLTLNGNVGQYAVPPGTYGDFTANGNSGFTLGIAGATQPAAYAFQYLTLNGNTAVRVVGPVVVTVANGFSLNGSMGSNSRPDWLVLRIASGNFTLNGKVTVCGWFVVPTGTVTVNGTSKLSGGVTADRLVLNGGSTLQLVDLPPVATMIAPANGQFFAAAAAPIMLQAVATDADGFIARVEFFADAVKLGETTAPPYQFAWTDVPAGSYVLLARATDNAGVSGTSAPVNVIVNAPPTVSLLQPAPGAVVATAGSLTLVATAADSDGSIAKVEFFQGTTKLGETMVAPYQLAISSLAAGSYTFTARATDDRGALTNSAPVSILVESRPTAGVTAPATVARGGCVVLTASAADSDGTVVRVEYFRDGVLIGTVTVPSGMPPSYAFTDTATLAPGLYDYAVRVYDDRGLYADSEPVSVAVVPTLPYTADFEPDEGYFSGPLEGQLGWSIGAGAASVTEDFAFNGTQSIVLAAATPPTQVMQTFAPYSGHDVVFVDLFARPVAETNPTDSTIFDAESARFAFLRNGTSGVLQAFDGDGVGGGLWQPTSFTTPLGIDHQVQDWVRLTARLDFARKTWDLYATGRMVAADMTFRDSAAAYLSSLTIRGDAVTSSRIDFLYAGATNPLFADVNNDGIDDTWETAHALSLATDDRSLAPAGNGVSVVESYVRGTDPNDYYQGVAPTLTKLGGDSQIASPGQFNSQPFEILVSDLTGAAPLANAPVAFTVTLGGGQLAITNTGTPSLASSMTLRTGADGTARIFYQQRARVNVASQIDVVAGTARAAFSTTSTMPLNDADGNGLPDDWENLHFGHTGVDPIADEDGDGMSNLQEYQSGQDPTDFFNGVAPVFTSMVNSTPVSVRIAGYNGQPTGPILLATDDTVEQGAQQSLAVHIEGFAATMAAPTAAGDSNAISVRLAGPDGTPLVNAPVIVTVINGGSLIAATDAESGATHVTVRTDANGIARVYIASLASPPGDLVISPQGGTNFNASLAASTYAMIDLGIYTWPVSVATDGTITFWNDWDLVRWRNGSVSTLQVPLSIYRYNSEDSGGLFNQNYVTDPIFDFYPEFGEGFVNRDGTIVSFASDRALTASSRSEEHFIVVWNKDSEDPITIKGPERQSSGPIYGETIGLQVRSDAILMAVEESGQIWAHNGDNSPQRYGDDVASVPAFSSSQMTPVLGSGVDGVIDSYFLSVGDANSSHQAVGSYVDKFEELQFFVGSPLNTVDFIPLAINDAGQVLGDDYDPFFYLYTYGYGQILTKPDAYTGNVIQDAQGYAALNPFVYSGGSKHYLRVPPSATPVRIVGLDEAGNVYGSINPQFLESFSPGQNVIWIAKPADWGLPASTPEYSPMLWEQPFLPNDATAISGVLPGAGRLQTTIQKSGVEADGYHALVLVPAGIAVDANRDGQIKFVSEDYSDATTADHPFRFWFNDDDDEWVTTTALGVVETETEQDDKNITDVSKQNWRGNVIPCERDLEDFARIQLSLSGLSDAVKNGQLYLGLKWKNTTGTPAIKLYRATDPDGTTGYLTTPSAATRQALEVAIVDARYPGYAPDGRFVSDHTLIEGTDVFVIPSLQFINLSESKPRTSFLFEGCKAGTGQLALVILKKETDGSFTTIGEGPGVWMDLKEPNQFIQRWTCGDGDRGAVSAVTLDPSKSGTFGAPSTDEEKDMVLYVHGYNMQEFEKQRWIETTYKRLWHLGYKGRVGGFTWPCAQSSVPFDQSEEKAWQAGTQLLALLNTLKSQGYRVHLIGHSQGNVVIGEALRQAGPNSAVATTYIASQAAVPAHCYDAAQPERSGSTAFTPDTPNIYSRFRTPNEDPYLPATWSTSDPAYLVQTQLQGSVGKFVNFFNPQDYALSGNGFSLLADDGSQPGWLADQRLKPDLGWGYNSTDGFVEVTGAAESPSVTRLTVALPAERYEIFAYCAEARSLALGASANMGGVFSGSGVNLTDAPFNFRNQHIYHSGQFRSFYAQRWQYWQQFLKSSDIDVRDTP